MFSNTIKELRIEADMTQARLAEALGCSQSMVARWEKGECEPTESIIVKAAQVFNVSTDVVLGCDYFQEPILRDIKEKGDANISNDIDRKRIWLIRQYELSSPDIKRAVDKLLS